MTTPQLTGNQRPSFPTRQFDDAGEFGGAYAAELTRALRSVDPARIAAAADVLSDAYDRDAAVFACGNGGSASIANHLQCDHVKGVRNGTDLTTRVFSLSTNIELLSAIANDLGYEMVFEYQLQSLARAGDVLIAVSSSGRSPNIVRALRVGECARDAHHRPDRVFRWCGAGAGDGFRARRIAQLRNHRGRPSSLHASARPVRPPVADDP